MKFRWELSLKSVLGFCGFFLAYCLFMRNYRAQPSRWKLYHYKKQPVPAEAMDRVENDEVPIQESFITVQNTSILVRKGNEAEWAAENPVRFLFLHGADETSSVWSQTTKSLQLMTSLGYHSEAIDLPGHGQSEALPKSPAKPGRFLLDTIKQIFGDQRVVLVVPGSNSELNALDTIMKFPGRFCGFIPIAPISTQDYEVEQFKRLKIPTLIVVEEGQTESESMLKLAQIPTSSHPQVLNGLGASPYTKDLVKWYKLLTNFARRLHC